MAAPNPFQRWTEGGETQTQEFKPSFDQACIETLVAFANAKGGRELVCVTGQGAVQDVTLGKESLNGWLVQIKAETSPSIIPELEAHPVKDQTRADYPKLQLQIEEIRGGTSITVARTRVSAKTAGNPCGGANGGANDDADATACALNLPQEKPGQRAHEIAAASAKSKRTIERILRRLKAQDAIEFRGATKTGGYHRKH
jgi:ATP-dependent DNA helicase RecG